MKLFGRVGDHLTRNNGNTIPVYVNCSEVYGLLMYQPEKYIEHWLQEKMVVYVDETGLRSITWENPIEVVEKLNENVPVKNFEEVKELIRKYIKFALLTILIIWILPSSELNLQKLCSPTPLRR